MYRYAPGDDVFNVRVPIYYISRPQWPRPMTAAAIVCISTYLLCINLTICYVNKPMCRFFSFYNPIWLSFDKKANFLI